MATDPTGDLLLTPIGSEGKTLAEWLTNFHLSLVVLDPYTNESSWILATADRIMQIFRGANVRVAFACTADEEGTRQFLGPLADDYLTFADPGRAVPAALSLARLPAWVVVQQDGQVLAAAEGWHPAEWRQVAKELAVLTSWSHPTVPDSGDPTPFEGTAALPA